MESVIARLLSDFESGKLSRRQLVQTLAMVAVGSPVASALAQAESREPRAAPFKTVWLDHISYAVSDYKKSVDFYSGLMGWKVKEDDGRQALLDLNGIGSILIRNARRPDAAPAATPPAARDTTGRPARPPVTGVINHIAFGVEPWDTDAVKAELERRGLTPRIDNQGENYKSFHVTDPDGWDLQISNQTKDKPIPNLPKPRSGE
jgi:catechol 2,3-dioxygenase-like lactoylglutathione lyase family enzyme